MQHTRRATPCMPMPQSSHTVWHQAIMEMDACRIACRHLNCMQPQHMQHGSTQHMPTLHLTQHTMPRLQQEHITRDATRQQHAFNMPSTHTVQQHATRATCREDTMHTTNYCNTRRAPLLQWPQQQAHPSPPNSCCCSCRCRDTALGTNYASTQACKEVLAVPISSACASREALTPGPQTGAA